MLGSLSNGVDYMSERSEVFPTLSEGQSQKKIDPADQCESQKKCQNFDGLNNITLDNNTPTGGTADAVAAGRSAAGE